MNSRPLRGLPPPAKLCTGFQPPAVNMPPPSFSTAFTLREYRPSTAVLSTDENLATVLMVRMALVRPLKLALVYFDTVLTSRAALGNRLHDAEVYTDRVSMSR